MGHTITVLLAASIPVMLVLVLFHGPLLYVMGARTEVLEQAKLYMTVMSMGAVFQVLSGGCIPLIRNKGKVVFAMVAMIIGGGLNCIGDYFLVFQWHWGVTGAALATLASQVFVFLCGVWFFLKKENRMKAADFKPDATLTWRTLRNGIAPFALTLVPEATTIAINISAGAYGGGTAQAAFAVISYTCISLQWIVQGVNDGSQPLVSRYFGMGDMSTVRSLRNANFAVTIGIGLAGVLLLNGFRPQLALIFGVSQGATDMLVVGMLMYSLSLPLYGFSHAVISYFYAMEIGRDATIIVVCETVGIAVFAYVLPLYFGLNGSWASIPATQVLLCGIAAVLLARSRKELEQRALLQVEKAQIYKKAG